MKVLSVCHMTGSFICRSIYAESLLAKQTTMCPREATENNSLFSKNAATTRVFPISSTLEALSPS